jgi:hypothetical protein
VRRFKARAGLGPGWLLRNRWLAPLKAAAPALVPALFALKTSCRKVQFKAVVFPRGIYSWSLYRLLAGRPWVFSTPGACFFCAPGAALAFCYTAVR